MTTPQAERLYQAQHLMEMADKGYAVYNPENKPIEELPAIYGWNNGGSSGWYHAQLLAEDGTAMGSHICSHECYMPHDLGILEGTRPDRHEGFKKHYPNGYRMEFIPDLKRIEDHAGLSAALKLNEEKRPPAEGENASVVIECSEAKQ